MKYFRIVIVALVVLVLSACENTQSRVLDSGKSQVELRSIQTRAFDMTNRRKALRTIIATLQDLEFVIDKADETLGVVSATKLKGYTLKMSVSIRPRGNTQLLIRANAQYNITPIVDPKPYQQFFSALSKAMFLEAHQVD